MPRSYRFAAMLLAGLLWAAAEPNAETLTYQGYLTDTAGVPVATARTLTFSLYDVPSGGTPLWQESHSVTPVNGVYSIELGTSAPLAASHFPTGTARWLGIQAGADAEMTPRQAMTHVARAIHASQADSASSADALSSAALGQYGLRSGLPARANTLTTVAAAGNVGHSAAMTLGADGLPVIAYLDAGNTDLKVAKCADPACTAATITTLDADGAVDNSIAITLSADDLPVVSYFDPASSGLKVAKCVDAACTGPATITVVDTLPVASLGGTAITLGTDGLPVIAYIHGAGLVVVAHCTDAACTGAGTYVVDLVGGGSTTARNIALTLGTDGLPVLAYYDGDNTRLKVAKCGNAACIGTTLFAVDSTGNSGRNPAIAIAADGLPLISYLDIWNADLKVAKCADAACAGAATLSTVESAGSVGGSSAIAIGADGMPLIAHYDASNGDLRYVRCANVACTATTTVTALDTAGDVGKAIAMVIGADGLPLVAYLDSGNGDLKFAKCANQHCINYLGRR